MAGPVAPLVVPAHERPVGETDAVRAAALLSWPSPEDLRLAQRVAHALRGTGYGPLRGVEVTVHERVVTLGGRVPSFHLKQVAQEAALAVPGAHQIHNDLEVRRPL